MRLVYQKVNPSGIPADEYTELEYLESSGTQYIDMNYIPKITSTYESKFSMTTITPTVAGGLTCLFGSCDSTNSVYTELFLPKSKDSTVVNQFLPANHSTVFNRPEYNIKANTDYTFKITDTDFILNGSKFCDVYIDTSVTTSQSLYLFSRHETSTSPLHSFSGKIYYFKIWEGNTLVRNFVPAKRVSDNVLGMYDTVTKSFFTNVGSGTFIAGNVVEKVIKPLIAHTNQIPSEYQELQYIESHGSQTTQAEYIDTGVTQRPLRVVLEATLPTTSVNSCFFGASYNSNNSSEYQGGFLNNYPYIVSSSVITQTSKAVSNYVKYKYEYTFGSTYKYTVYNEDGTVFYTNGSTNGKDLTSSYTFIMCRRGLACNTSTSHYSMSARYHSFKMYELDGTLIRDFIPAKRKSDNVIGMYDSVTNSFYENAGTGTFTAGPEVHKVRLMNFEKYPSYIKPVQYLQSTGTQYINTGVVPTNSTKSYIDFMVDRLTNYSTLFGAHSNLTSTADYTRYNYYPFTNIGTSTINFRSILGNASVQYEWSSSTMVGVRHNILFNDNYKMYFDGDLVHTFTEFETVPTNPIYMFWASGLPTDTYRTNGKMYSCKIWDNGTLVRDFIPAINRANNNKPCMFDLVSQTPFYNVGSGEFITP